MKFKDYIILIPSRLGSTRLKNKPLIKINGEPLIVHVFKSVQKSKIPILVATGSELIVDLIKKISNTTINIDNSIGKYDDRILNITGHPSDIKVALKMLDKYRNVTIDYYLIDSQNYSSIAGYRNSTFVEILHNCRNSTNSTNL